MGGLIKGTIVGIVAAVVLAAALGTPVASAEVLSPWWGLTLGSQPTNLLSGADGRIVVTAENRGDASTSGEVTISDTLPAGLEATGIEATAGEEDGEVRPVSCVVETLTCTFGTVEATKRNGERVPESLRPYEEIEVDISVSVGAGASNGEQNTAVVSGGGSASTVSASHAIEVDGSERFGIEDFQMIPENAGGSIDTQAGSHPFQLTSIVTLNTKTPEPGRGPETLALVKDIDPELPAGLIADPAQLVRCTEAQFNAEVEERNACPAGAAVGVATVTFNEPESKGLDTVTTPVFNLTPLPGEPARFGIKVLGQISALLKTSIRSGGDYGVTLAAIDINQQAYLLSLKLTFWGVPGDARHNDQRGWECLDGSGACTASAATSSPAFLSLPSSCEGPLQSTVVGDSWARPQTGELETLASFQTPVLDGCNQLSFEPQIGAEPSTNSAVSPSGLNLDLDFHDEGLADAEGLAESPLQKLVVTLPAGVTLNPSAGLGLGGCTQAGYTAETLESLPGSGCPNNSKIGTVEIATPLLTAQLSGSIFLAQPYENPFSEAGHPSGSLLALYLVARNPETGLLIKLAGKLEAGGQAGVAGLASGQLRATFAGIPQLPFDHFDLHFREGPQALLITPPACGTYVTQAQPTPYSEPTTALTDTSSFTISSGSEGGACPPTGAGMPFNPQMQAGTLNENAGAASPFYLHLTRSDSDQEIASFSAELPPGITAVLAGIPTCSEADIALARTKTVAQEEAEPSCPAASEIGHTLIGTGVGSVLDYLPGKIYLAGPFQGAPFSLLSVTSAKVGPLDLGTVVLHLPLTIDPNTAQIGIDPAGGGKVGSQSSEPIPEIIDGIVTHVRDIRLYIERPGGAPFILNPTSCAPTAVTSTLTSGLGQSATVASRFQAADCASLKFSPKLTALTRANGEFQGHGASLHMVIAVAAAQANMRSLKLDLPQRLPARLETIQKACPERTFDANPAACPKASVVGSASVQTPILSTMMTGPAYLVSKNGTGPSTSSSSATSSSFKTTAAPASHPGESKTEKEEAAFPNLVLVLQGQDVRIDLTGGLFVSEKNITSVTFRSIPDVPISRLDLILPEGKTSILAASSGLCTKRPLSMTTAITAQNGARQKPTVKVAVSGCKKPKRHKQQRARARAKNKN